MKKFIKTLSLFIILMFSFLSVQGNDTIYIKLIEDDINSTTYNADFFNTNSTLSNIPYVDDTKGIVLTSGSQGMASSFFLNEKMSRASNTSPGFSTYFQMNIYRGSSSQPADGIVFVVAANTNSLGSTGGGLGYQGIPDSVGIEFDFYNNGLGRTTTSFVPHIDVSTNGNLASDSPVNSTFDATFNSDYTSASRNSLVRNYHVWIDWNELNSTLEIRVNKQNDTRPEDPTFSKTNLNLDALNDTYYAGFTAATGGLYLEASIKRWYFANEYLENGVDVANLSFTVDSTPPTSPSILYNSTENHVLLDGASDLISGIFQVQYSFDNITFNEYANPITINQETTLYARAIDNAGNISSVTSLNYYRLTYLENGINQNLYYPSGHTVSLPSDVMAKEGYSFVGFSMDLENQNLITEISITENTQIYPVFHPLDYTITFNQTLGAIQSPLTQAYTSSLSLPVLEEPGYTFEGWFDETNTLVAYESMPLGDQILTALFIPIDYTVVFNSLLGTTPSSIQAPFNSMVILPILSEDGYAFEGWLYENELITQSMIMPLSGASIVSKFTPLDYTITFNQTLGAIQSPLTQAYTSSLSLPVLEEPGYTFEGWFDETNTLVAYESMPLGDQILTALFIPIDYTVVFNSSFTSNPEPIIQPYLSLITLPLISFEGYTFIGWNDGEVVITENQMLMPLEGIVLEAVFEINEYTIIYQSNAEFTLENETYLYQDVIEFPHFEREGYTFTGWIEGSRLFKKTRMPASNITLKAQWEINKYSLTLMVDGDIFENLDLEYNESLMLKDAFKEGHQFLGWSMGEEIIKDLVMPSSSLILEAVFEPSLYTVNYVVNGVNTEISIPYGDIFKPISPNRKGYRFDGWMLEDEEVTEVIVDVENLVLHAMFTPLSSSQTIITPLGQTTIHLSTDEPVGRLSSIHLPSGYRFVGFYTQPFGGGRSVNEDDLIDDASSVIIYPHYLSTRSASLDYSTTLSLNGRGIINESAHSFIIMPWLEISVFVLTTSLIIFLYVKSKEPTHGSL